MSGTLPAGVPRAKITPLPQLPEDAASSRTFVDAASVVLDVPDLSGRSRIHAVHPEWMTMAEALALARLLQASCNPRSGL